MADVDCVVADGRPNGPCWANGMEEEGCGG